MKQLALAVIGLFLATSSTLVAADSALSVRDLRCEYAVNPLGIDVLAPRLSWKLESAARGQKQSAYQVLVATSRAKLEPGQADLWDSGKVASDQAVHVVYAGKPMTSALRCYWKVRAWDTADQPTLWSADSHWEMGLLAKDEWHGQWIARTDDPEYQPAPLLRKTFELGKKVQRARVYICGLSYYELSLNGQRVGDHVLDPGYTRFDRRALYVTHDVTGLLKEGKNALGAMLGTGWYNCHVKAVWDFEKAPWRAAPKLLMDLRITFDDGSTQTIVSDGSWKCSTGPVVYDSIYSGETYDARLEKAGWDTPAYDDAAWQAAKVVKEPGGIISAQMLPPIKVMKDLKPVRLWEAKPGVWVFDMGQNMAGWAQLRVKADAGTQIVMKYGERLNADLTIDQADIAKFTWRPNPKQPFQVDTYIAKGGVAEEVWECRFSYKGFQYVEVTGLPGKPTLDTLTGRVVHTAAGRTAQFACSDEMLNKIHAATCWSYVGNFHSIPTDCPHREKNGWTGDAHLAAEFGMYHFDTPTFYTKWLGDLQDEMRPSGELPGICPTAGWGYAWGNGPAWDSAYILIPWYMYQYYGDTAILAKHYDHMKRYVDYLTSKSKDSIVSIGLGDWVAPVKTPVEVTSTAYYFVDARIVAQAAGILGKSDDAKKYADLAQKIRLAFNQKFVNAEAGQVAPGTQCALSCALYQGLLDPKDEPAVFKNLVAAIDARFNHIDTGILGAKYVFNCLIDQRPDLGYWILTRPDSPGWAAWINRGATTLWEDWDQGSSRNHIMYGDVSAWMIKVIAGIRSTAPGFRQVLIKPNVINKMAWCKASYESIQGTIVSQWKVEGGKFTLDVTIPANTMAEVSLPCGDAAKVTEGGKDLKEAGLQDVRVEKGRVIAKVGSGAYQFSCPAK